MRVRRRLDAEIVRRGLLPSRAQAVAAIAAGRVLVAGRPALVPARLVNAGEAIRVDEPPTRYVSRGGEKLAAALDRFGVMVSGRRALDVGASTGGFTDCLLQAGAAHVMAVDVGRGQLAWSLRNDSRVTLLEQTNARTLTTDDIGEPAELVVADVSFISLVTIAPALVSCSTDDADFVLLVKPQFEAGRARVGKGGVVRDHNVHRAVLSEVRQGLAQRGLIVIDVMPSPLRGADGNVEFLVRATRTGTPVTDAALDAAVAESRESRGATDGRETREVVT
jgi:23S rRNA (cytidine1920-2'-O)/16S rRNA (cytidine1409-2'-O)-methyltransferase